MDINTGQSEAGTDELLYEGEISQRLHNEVNLAHDVRLPMSDRNTAWERSVDLVTNKRIIRQRVNQIMRPTYYGEFFIDNSKVYDEVVLDSYSPHLKSLVDTYEVDTQAAYAVMESFLRQRPPLLSEIQAVQLARNFPPLWRFHSFQEFKNTVESQQFSIEGKSPEEIKVIKEQIVNILQITDTIARKYLLDTSGKTVSIVDLTKISVGALDMLHEVESNEGVQRMRERDKQLISSHEITSFRDTNAEMITQFASAESILREIAMGRRSPDLYRDLQDMFPSLEGVNVTGLEHVPQQGPVILAFSHLSNWLDSGIAPNWELLRMIQSLSSVRQDIYITAWLNHFKHVREVDTSEKKLPSITDALQVAESLYGLHVIDPSKHFPNVLQFFDEAQSALKGNHVLAIAPEGTATSELIKPKRGVGTIARTSQAHVIPVAFRETRNGNGTFGHDVIFLPSMQYNSGELEGNDNKTKDQSFADNIMRSIAQTLPEDVKGIFR